MIRNKDARSEHNNALDYVINKPNYAGKYKNVVTHAMSC